VDSSTRQFITDGEASPSPIGFRERTGFMGGELLHRYLDIGRGRGENTGRPATGMEMILAGFTDDLFVHVDPGEEARGRARRAAARVGADELLERSILNMSHGQAARVLLARALAPEPDILFLDEFTEGLDPEARREALAIIGRIAGSGVPVVMSSHRPEELPPQIDKVAILDHGRIVRSGPRREMLASLPSPAVPRQADDAAPPGGERQQGEIVVDIRDADVYLERMKVLERIAWQVRRGERWAVVGANGSGKTTLLRLIRGEIHPAFEAGDVLRFDLPSRTPAEEYRRRIGWVAPSLQTAHVQRQTVLETVLSGLTDSVGMWTEADEQDIKRALALIEEAGLAGLADRDVAAISYGQMRRALLARARMNEPELYLLDEPMGGLDAQARAEFAALLDGLEATVVCATHHLAENELRFDKVLALESGRVAYQGPVGEFFRQT
jgi:molybdate transport system ATP-binding protein